MMSPAPHVTRLHPDPLIVGTMARQGDDRGARVAIYQHAIELGLTTFDTAPLYGFGVAETLLGEAIARYPREQLRILGKVGLRWDAGDHGDVLFQFEDADRRRRTVRKDSRPESIRTDVERSLERLGTGYLDLVQIHHPDPHTPIGETMAALEALVRDGKVRHVGVSNFSLEQIRAARAALREVELSSFQGDYSLLRREAERDVLPHCRASALLFFAYSPLAGGHLARVSASGPVRGNRSLRSAVRDSLAPLAERHGVHPSAIAVAWILAQPGVTSAITGASTVAQLQEQAGAPRVALADEEILQLGRAFAGIEVVEPGHSRLRRGYRAARRLAGTTLRALGIDPARLRRGPRSAGW